MDFAELSLPDNIVAAAQAQGFITPTPVQVLVIPPALEGSDILGGAPTGTGKTAAYLLPVLARLCMEPEKKGARALVLTPTRELALQVCKDANALCASLKEVSRKQGAELQAFAAYTIIGGEGRDVQQQAQGNIVCATPGRLNEFIDKGWFDPKSVELLIIDEADRMLDLGFKDEVASIVRAVSARFQTMLFSATLDSAGVREFAGAVLNDPFEVDLRTGGADNERLPELLSARAYYAASYQQKYKIMAHLLKTAAGKAIIFVRTRDKVNEVCAFLRKQGVSAASLQGEMNITERKAALRRFSDNEVRILVATDVAARGLDVPDTEQVYNFDLPAKADVYVHRAGRTARAGSKGTVISFVEPNELALLERIERYTGREVERREIKYVCTAFPKENTLPTRREGRASIGGRGGFDKKRPQEKEKAHVKERWRDKKNKGKPDFAAKRAKKRALQEAREARQTKVQTASATPEDQGAGKAE